MLCQSQCSHIHQSFSPVLAVSRCAPGTVPPHTSKSSPVLPHSGELRMQKLVLSSENTELKRSPFTAWSRSVYSHTCYAYCQGVLSFLLISTPGPFTCIFSKTAPNFSVCWLWLTHGSCVGPQNKIGHPAGCRFPC